MLQHLIAEIDNYDPIVIDRVDRNDSPAKKLAVISRLERETDNRILRVSQKIAVYKAKVCEILAREFEPV